MNIFHVSGMRNGLSSFAGNALITVTVGDVRRLISIPENFCASTSMPILWLPKLFLSKRHPDRQITRVNQTRTNQDRKELLELEHRYGGRAFAYVGKCLYCPDSECARKCNRPCLHPDKVRPSLEAFGFDIARTLSELFGIELLWGKNDILPEYLVLVSGLFHNSTENIISHTKRNPDSGNL